MVYHPLPEADGVLPTRGQAEQDSMNFHVLLRNCCTCGSDSLVAHLRRPNGRSEQVGDFTAAQVGMRELRVRVR